ncbi:MAG: IS110 family transposase [Candidatus Omnitrophica bacterium]|nr:IS110 family transposase [Candidatus Omnitrophota bacterium]
MAKRMTKRKRKSTKKLSKLTIQNPNAAGIDVGSIEQWVAVNPELHENPIRCFASFTRDLNELADWLIDCNVNTVAMESTGVYWIPLFHILDARGFEVILVNTHSAKNVSGRKDDESDCEWIRTLHSYGLLRASFQPDDNIRALRAYLRDRDTLSKSISSHIKRMQKALTQMNIQLHNVISDITGKTGMNILRAILDGERDPEVLATFLDRRIKATKEKIIKSLEGNYLKEHLASLNRYLQLYDFYRHQIDELDREIEELLMTFPSLDDHLTELKDEAKSKKRRKTKAVNAPKFRTPDLPVKRNHTDS